MKPSAWHPYEALVRDRIEAGEHARPTMLERQPSERPERQVQVSVRPATAFAAAALVVAALAFTYTLGRRDPLVPLEPETQSADSLETVRRERAVDYEQLQVDRGRRD